MVEVDRTRNRNSKSELSRTNTFKRVREDDDYAFVKGSSGKKPSRNQFKKMSGMNKTTRMPEIKPRAGSQIETP